MLIKLKSDERNELHSTTQTQMPYMIQLFRKYVQSFFCSWNCAWNHFIEVISSADSIYVPKSKSNLHKWISCLLCKINHFPFNHPSLYIPIIHIESDELHCIPEIAYSLMKNTVSLRKFEALKNAKRLALIHWNRSHPSVKTQLNWQFKRILILSQTSQNVNDG